MGFYHMSKTTQTSQILTYEMLLQAHNKDDETILIPFHDWPVLYLHTLQEYTFKTKWTDSPKIIYRGYLKMTEDKQNTQSVFLYSLMSTSSAKQNTSDKSFDSKSSPKNNNFKLSATVIGWTNAKSNWIKYIHF